MSHCKVPRCPSSAVALGLCQKHYGRYRRHGTTELLRPVKKIQFKNYGAQLLYAAERGNRLALARKIGLKHNELSHYVYGRRIPSFERAYVLEEKAGVSMMAWKSKPVSAKALARS